MFKTSTSLDTKQYDTCIYLFKWKICCTKIFSLPDTKCDRFILGRHFPEYDDFQLLYSVPDCSLVSAATTSIMFSDMLHLLKDKIESVLIEMRLTDSAHKNKYAGKWQRRHSLLRRSPSNDHLICKKYVYEGEHFDGDIFAPTSITENVSSLSAVTNCFVITEIIEINYLVQVHYQNFLETVKEQLHNITRSGNQEAAFYMRNIPDDGPYDNLLLLKKWAFKRIPNTDEQVALYTFPIGKTSEYHLDRKGLNGFNPALTYDGTDSVN
ncbi:hypothetical protein BDF20DRAFT_839111 [Mycotypha africana]|uniref:uncharacterized protein n=1 Tax=Mycotypha africana TaxID=64632 RepID=UPI0023008844|nr:uncharacterized protein BDF20DRAFT_839111 [Mycotypha africana]KAI8969163.1 hypothetical protein BDF20DRAFT_839111 [Mycotypha africana]